MPPTHPVYLFLFTISILFLLLLGFSFAFIEPGSGPFVIAVLALIPTLAILLLLAVLTYLDWDPIQEIQ